MDVQRPYIGEVMISSRFAYMKRLEMQIRITMAECSRLLEDLEELTVELRSEDGVYDYDEAAATQETNGQQRSLFEEQKVPF